MKYRFMSFIAVGLAIALAACGNPNAAPPPGAAGFGGNAENHAAGGNLEHGFPEPPSAPPAETPAPSAASGGDFGEAEQADDLQKAEAFEVSIENFSYAPGELTVPAGSKITFTNKDGVGHTATADGAFDSGMLGRNDSFTVTLDTAGEYDVYCKPHPYMRMKLIVQ